jgi:hypothetical protein
VHLYLRLSCLQCTSYVQPHLLDCYLLIYIFKSSWPRALARAKVSKIARQV